MSSAVHPGEPTRAKSHRLTPSADWAFAAVLALGAVIVLFETSGFSFFSDDWDFVVDRRGIGLHTLLDPHGPHLSLFPILIYKVLLKVFGGGSYLPFRLLSMFDLVLLGLALGLACRHLWGRWWGLAPVLLLVTLGPAGVSTLWSFQIGFALAVAFGVFALLALRERRWWSDPAGCLCLVISLGSASQGVGFVIGAAFMLVLTGGWKRRSWVVLIPAVLYVIWYVTIGHAYGETRLSLWPTALSYEMQTLGVTAASLCGLSSVLTTGTLDPTFAAPIAAVVVIAIAAFAWRGWRPPPLFWGAAATAVVVWFAAAVSDFAPYGRPPTEPRYLASDGILILICLCAAVPRPRLPRGGIIIAGIVLAVVCATNADQYGQQHTSFLAGARQQRAELGALELMRPFVSPTYNPGVIDANLIDDYAAPFFGAVDSFGLREATPRQIEEQPESTRDNVDHILAPNEITFMLQPAVNRQRTTLPRVLTGSPGRSGDCLIVGVSALEIVATPGVISITAAKQYPSTVIASRFASSADYELGTIPAGGDGSVSIRSDLAPSVPWRLTLTGTGSQVCAD